MLTGRDNVDERTLFDYSDEVNRKWQEQYEAGRKVQVKVTAKMFLITKGSSMISALISLLVALTLIGPVVYGQMTAGMFMGIISAVFGMIQKLGFQMSRSRYPNGDNYILDGLSFKLEAGRHYAFVGINGYLIAQSVEWIDLFE